MRIEKYCYDGKEKFDIKDFDTKDDGGFKDRSEAITKFIQNLRDINVYQQKLYAERKEGLIFVFQAMDAAGKDGVIRTVFSTLSPHGLREYCFKAPSVDELAHDFLWRFWSALPARGNISIFNRSYYEDVLVGKVHKLYENQVLPKRIKKEDVIQMRYDQINDYEKYLYNTGTRIIKIFLNVSFDEQGKRFISRIDTPKKNWKISVGDIEERKYWKDYMEAFEKMVNVTSTKLCPWYVVPADHKWYARLVVSEIVLDTLKEIDSKWPEMDEKTDLVGVRKEILDSLSDKDLEMERFEDIFLSPSILVEDMLAKEEETKIKEKNNEIKESGLKTINKLAQDGYIIKNPNDIVNKISDGMKKDAKQKLINKEERKDKNGK